MGSRLAWVPMFSFSKLKLINYFSASTSWIHTRFAEMFCLNISNTTIWIHWFDNWICMDSEKWLLLSGQAWLGWVILIRISPGLTLANNSISKYLQVKSRLLQRHLFISIAIHEQKLKISQELIFPNPTYLFSGRKWSRPLGILSSLLCSRASWTLD
jgi:hypothetical protein